MFAIIILKKEKKYCVGIKNKSKKHSLIKLFNTMETQI